MAYNDITGESISTKYGSKEAHNNYENNFDAIFSKTALCKVCGKDASSTKECAFTGCPLNWDEARIDVVGTNGNDGLHYGK